MADEAYTDVNYKSICCEQIPVLFLDKLVAKKYFSKFGKIKRFILRPNRLSCTVEYETEDEAERAMESGGIYNGVEFLMKYAEREVGHVQNTEEWVDADVQAELDAMGGRQQPIMTASKKLPAPQIKTNSWTKTNLKPAEKLESVISPISATPKFDPAVRNELEALLRQPALTAEDKYRVLDARDKLIRLLSIKQTDIAKAESRKGICPDMCPEKERLMRDFQRQVSIFELNYKLGSISHQRAIKEYSRSSADQEVPLLHELRPERVLKLTMLYLMHNIMDQLESTQVSVSDWFHFVWDRTRSIRKDITQQELCSLDAVELVEQCARFHIHCGARLIAEEPSVFDKKINAENLTKCLQTLKYLYHDLRFKNVRCPREAEFRGYIVLLNLGNSNFLWEVKQLPEDLQKSREIKRAMEFYNVLQNNNYVRFFNMVRETETSYLSACILLNYFTKLRVRAMEAIVKSHNWRKDGVFLPLKYLTKILGFEDENAAVHFFGYHGLECSEQRGVLLERLTPASDYIMDRALKLVESKRNVSVGECICGHPLESLEIFKNHQPHNSFDENGLLKAEAWTADDQLRGEAAIAKAKERKLKAAQMMQQPQQQLWSATTTTTMPPAAPNKNLFSSIANSADSNIFKIPRTSPQLSPRQQYQQQQQQQQFVPKPTTGGFSIFNKAITSASNVNSANIFSKNLSTAPENTATAGLFSSNTTGGENIFGNAVSKNIFGQRLEASVDSVPPDNNAFQYFQQAASGAPSNLDTPKSIFGAAGQTSLQDQLEAEKQRQKAEREADELEAKRLAELEIQQQAKAAEEERRQKLAADEQRRRELEAAKIATAAEHRRRLDDLQCRALRETETMLSQTIDLVITTVASNELARYQNVESSTTRLTAEILNELVSEQVTDIANIEYSIICHDRMLLEQYFQIWLNETRKKIEQRRLLASTPMWVPAETREQIAAKIQHPNEALNIQMIKRYRHGEPCDFSKILNLHDDDEHALRWRQSIDICEMIAKFVAKKRHSQRRSYFKMLFNLPSEKQELYGFESLCNKWLSTVLRFPHKPQSNDENPTPAYINCLQENVALCVRKVSGTPPLNEIGQRANNAECDQLDGIVFLMSIADLAQSRRRLHHLLQTSSNFKRLPITFIVYGNNKYEETELEAALDLLDLTKQKKLSTYCFYNCYGRNADHRFKVLLEHALNFVIKSSFESNATMLSDLQMQSTQQWLETCLGEEMWRRWQSSWLRNPVFGKVCNLMPHVVGLYNAAVEKLTKIIETDLSDAPDFPQELRKFVPKIETGCSNLTLDLPHFPPDWKSKSRQKVMLKFLEELTLPHVEGEQPDDVNALKLWLLNYAGQCLPYDDEKATTAAYYAITSLIEQLKSADLKFLDIEQRLRLVNYLPIVKVFVFAHVNEQIRLAHAANCLPNEVIYKLNLLASYLVQPWWLNYEAVQSVCVVPDAPPIDDDNDDEVAMDLALINDPLAEIEAVLDKADEIVQHYEKQINGEQSHDAPEADNRNSQLLILQHLNHKVDEMEMAVKATVCDQKCGQLKRSRASNETNDYKNAKRLQENSSASSETDDAIAKACAIIEKVNAFRDLEFKLDYTASKFNI